MRGYAYRLKRHMARHRRLWLAGGLAVAGLVVVVGALYFGAPDNSPIALSPPAHYDARWSFRELQSQIDGGHVVSVTVAGNAQNQPSLLANTTDHQVGGDRPVDQCRRRRRRACRAGLSRPADAGRLGGHRCTQPRAVRRHERHGAQRHEHRLPGGDGRAPGNPAAAHALVGTAGDQPRPALRHDHAGQSSQRQGGQGGDGNKLGRDGHDEFLR